jgi:hypothetical protein
MSQPNAQCYGSHSHYGIVSACRTCSTPELTSMPLLALAWTLPSSGRGDWFRRLVAWLLWLKRHNDSPVWQMYLQLMPLVRACRQQP